MSKSLCFALLVAISVGLVGYFGSPWTVVVDVFAVLLGAWAFNMKRATVPRAAFILLSLLTAASGLWFVSGIIVRQHLIIGTGLALTGIAAPGMLGAGLARWNKGRIVARSRIPGHSSMPG